MCQKMMKDSMIRNMNMVTHTLFPVLRLMSTSSGDSGLTVSGEAEIHYNEYCSEEEIDFCKENVTGRHIQ